MKLKNNLRQEFQIILDSFATGDSFEITAGSKLQYAVLRKKGNVAGNLTIGKRVKSQAAVNEVNVLTITHVPTSNSTLTVTINGAASANITVATTDSLEGVATKIAAVLPAGTTAVAVGATVVYTTTLAGVTTGAETLTPGTTGVTGSITTTVVGAAAIVASVGTEFINAQATGTSDGSLLDVTVAKTVFDTAGPWDVLCTGGAKGTLYLGFSKMF